jgi:hypothetical protein
MGNSISPSNLVEQFGGSFAGELGIDLSGGEASEIQKWFLAAILYGARISGKIAANTYAEFNQAGLVSPETILCAGWQELVRVLGRGGYKRYDCKTADKLLRISHTLLQEYAGDLNTLHRAAIDELDLERRVNQLGKGIGDVTVNIFLREMRCIWPKAQPILSEGTVQAAKALGFVHDNLFDRARILQILKAASGNDGMRPVDFPEFEAALVRYGATLRRKRTSGTR